MNENLRALSSATEQILHDAGLTLTMGGEPTFVPPQPDGAEWNTAAMGPEKLGYARRLTAQLLENPCKDALAMQVFGKWYPGEPLPRWTMLTLARRDGRPLWPAPARLLLEDREGRNEAGVAEHAARVIAEALGHPSRLLPASESTGVAGYVLPLDYEEGTWISDDWYFDESSPVPLFSGDSPIGLRLPLNDVPEDHLRRALTVEVRHGALEIFIPPLLWVGFEALIPELLRLAEKHDWQDIVFCGYAPAETGGAVKTVGLAADPGVLEANLPVCTTWQDYDEALRSVFDAAQSVGLLGCKFSLNGQEQGTGGGNHLAFGGPSLEDNPFVKQPALLASVLRYWQHHPALSYFFSGPYLGPGCQAPRVDESTPVALYELETACLGLEGTDGTPTPEWFDQLLRNLLTDAGGNTHRAEICLDKFCNPAAPNGRTGIIELRAFETYDDVELLSQTALLVRAIIARLIREPFREPLVRWGPALYDRFMLPTALWDDLSEICADLEAHSLPLQVDAFQPFFTKRFAACGELPGPDGLVLKVRQALEPWPLMAEESQGQATVRMVDNSVDRLELAVEQPEIPEQIALVVNGFEIPLHPVRRSCIAGLRYKSASAYPALHPHVPIQSPLYLAWVERDGGKIISAARYFFWNPDDPLYPGRPANAEEARQRREYRWKPSPELHGSVASLQLVEPAPETKYTVDLRRQLTQPGAPG